MTYRLFVLVLLLLLSLPALAHHGSNISYQLDKTITLEGVVTEWDYRNPHPQIYFDVKDKTGNRRTLGDGTASHTLDAEEHECGLEPHDDKARRPHRAGLQPVESCGREGVPREGTDA